MATQRLHGRRPRRAWRLSEIGIDQRRRAILDARVSLITSGDLPREMEAAGLIRSGEHILDPATEQGRTVERRRRPAEDPEAREHLRAQLGAPDGDDPPAPATSDPLQR